MDLAAARRRRTRPGGAGGTAARRGAGALRYGGRLQAAGLERRAAPDRRRTVHQPLGGAADADRSRRARPGPVRRTLRYFRRQLCRNAGPAGHLGAPHRLRSCASRIGDDVDFCWRNRLAGHRVVVVPSARMLPRVPPAARPWHGLCRAPGTGPSAAKARPAVGAAAACCWRPPRQPPAAGLQHRREGPRVRLFAAPGHSRGPRPACCPRPRAAQRCPHPPRPPLRGQSTPN